MSASSHGPSWPDSLTAPDRDHINEMLSAFWHQLRQLSDILKENKPHSVDVVDAKSGDENLLAIECVAGLRAIVVNMMLALNGIARPAQTVNLNAYLSANQRTVLERTLRAPEIEASTWIGQAVSLVVIYRWYAPQLVERHGLSYPTALEEEVWQTMRRRIYEWPVEISTDPVQ